MLIFKNFKNVRKKWNSIPLCMGGKIYIAKKVFFIFKVTDFCFIDRAWKTNKHKNTAMKLKSSIDIFCHPRRGANCLSEPQNRFKIGWKIKKLSRFQNKRINFFYQKNRNFFFYDLVTLTKQICSELNHFRPTCGPLVTYAKNDFFNFQKL